MNLRRAISLYADQSPEVQDRICFTALLAIVIPVLWLLPAGSSFWRDEAGTFWDVKNGLHAVLGARWLGQSPLYYVTAWVAYLAGGSGEFALRVPSMLAMAGAAAVLYRVAIRMFDPSIALLSVLVFLCEQHVAFAANDARPYALALLAVNTSMLLLLRWLETGGLRAAAALAAGAAFVIYAHYFFAPILIVEAAYALYRIRKGSSPARISELLGAIAAAGLLVLPLTGHVLSLFHNRGNVSLPLHVSLFDLMDTIAPGALIAPIAIGLLLAFLLRSWQAGVWNFPPNYFWLAFTWAFFVPALYFLLTVFTPLKLFVSRYILSGAPGMALLTAGVIGSLAAGRSRRIVAASLSAGAVLAFGMGRLHGNEDWRGALDAVRIVTKGGDTPVLIVSAITEGSDLKTLNDPHLGNLFAPTETYAPGATMIRLPIFPGEAALMQVDYLDQIATTRLWDQKRFVLVAPVESMMYGPWLMGRFAGRVANIEDLGDFGNVSAVLFQLQ